MPVLWLRLRRLRDTTILPCLDLLNKTSECYLMFILTFTTSLTLSFTLSFTIYGLPAFCGDFSPRIEASRGKGSPHFSRYKKYKNSISTSARKNVNEMICRE